MGRHNKIVENYLEVEETDNGEEEEALSLCDLPIKEAHTQSIKQTPRENKLIQDEFDFCSSSKQSEMCSADQVFFQGQILPLRLSVSSETGLLSSRSSSTTSNPCLSRADSMSTYHSTAFTSGGTSRSSSIRSHQSSTSSRSSSIRSHQSSSNGSSTRNVPSYKPKVPNNFNSHPSPKPQIKFSRIKNQNMPNSAQKSTAWSLFRLGLVTTPEIVLDDLKHRSINNNRKFQKSQSHGNISSNNSDDCTRFIKSDKKKKQGIFEVNATIFNTCKCSSNAVDIIPSKIGSINRVVKEKDESTHEELRVMKQEQEGKQSISRNRTFEWLKQLSLDGPSSSSRNNA